MTPEGGRPRRRPGRPLRTDLLKRPLPALAVLVDAAEAGLHPWVREHVDPATRRAALTEELGFWLTTAAQDMAYARSFAAAAPQSGEPPESYLDRWLAIGTGGHVLAGPRYLGRDPNLPFVMVTAADRPLQAADRDALAAVAAGCFGAFQPGFIMVTAADPVGAWPGTRPEMRQVIGRLADLRRAGALSPDAASTAIPGGDGPPPGVVFAAVPGGDVPGPGVVSAVVPGDDNFVPALVPGSDLPGPGVVSAVVPGGDGLVPGAEPALVPGGDLPGPEAVAGGVGLCLGLTPHWCRATMFLDLDLFLLSSLVTTAL